MTGVAVGGGRRRQPPPRRLLGRSVFVIVVVVVVGLVVVVVGHFHFLTRLSSHFSALRPPPIPLILRVLHLPDSPDHPIPPFHICPL
eukprot:2354351-Pyramimonas_sp.AAC.1